MRSSINFITSAAIISLARAATLRVDVGLNGLSYTPNITAAAAGDTVEFHFHPKNHNVAQTSFDAPCNSGSFANPFYSGFVPVTTGEATTVFRLLINDTKPIWYFCGQTTHCQSGMVGVINQPATGNTLDLFKASAAKTSNSTNPPAISGGILAANSGNSTGGGSGSGSASASASASAGKGGATKTASGGSGGATITSTAGAGAATGAGAGTSASGSASGSASAAPSSAGIALRAMRWSELLGMSIVVGGAALLVQ